jgi:hypothetical protein
MEEGCLHNVGISRSSVQCVRVVAKEESEGLGRLRDGFFDGRIAVHGNYCRRCRAYFSIVTGWLVMVRHVRACRPYQPT